MQRKPTFLMANLGSEVSQIFSYLDRQESKMAEDSLNRASRIINELMSHPELDGRTEEVEILEDIIYDLFLDQSQFSIEKSEIEEYFIPFALRALAENKII